MFLSIIIVTQNHPVKILRTLSSIKAQSDSDYEVILVDDSGFQPKSTALELLSDNFYNFDNKIQVISSLRGQGFSYAVNAAINIANGEYFLVLDEGQILKENAVATLKTKIKENHKELVPIDMLEFKLYYSTIKGESYLRNDLNKLLTPKIQKEVFANVHTLINTKVFRTQFIQDHKIEFINYVRNDSLFIYKALANSDGFLAIDDVLAEYELGTINYSVFDLLKQWVHIFNFYREIGLYKEYHDELEYAFIRFCLISFLRMVRLQNNKKLAIKGVVSAQNKIERRLRNFKENKYVQNINDEKFAPIVQDIEGYLKNWKLTYAK
ncbi:glycosyltransferase family 2 protein [Spiroplasma sp. DGKH1]|uniref:glycosyltransferase family 2 protein n=1 Tax=Spiroplasma sp. DGKH1 TaxID=3050074 RepID=UPI0034C60780